jgi:hypothetical protein
MMLDGAEECQLSGPIGELVPFTSSSSSVAVISGRSSQEYVAHYNEHRPHRALGQQAPGTFGVLPDPIDEPDPAQLRRNEILGGLINGYRLAG